MPDYSKQAQDLADATDNAIHVYEVYGAKVCQKVQELWDSRLPKNTRAVSVQDFATAAIRQLTLCKIKMLAADIELVKEQGESRQANQILEEQGVETKERFVGYLKMLEGMYGDELLMLLGLSGPTPQDTRVLEARIRAAITVLNSEKKAPNGQSIPFSLPKPLNPYLPSWDKANLIKAFRDIGTGLSQAVNAYKREQKESQEARIERRQAMSECREALMLFNDFFERFCRQANENEIADRIRSRGGRPRKRSEGPNPTAESGETPAAAT